MQTITVKYIGKSDAIVTEYNGVKYTFSKTKSVVSIPVNVFQHLMDRANPYRTDIIPYGGENLATPKPQEKAIEEKTNDVQKVNKEEPVRQRGRPKKIK